LFCTLLALRIDLNADVGESFGAYAIGHDPGLMKSITSANVAAGFHAGDPSVLRATIRRAKANGVAVGAHPSFPDLAGFGRREMVMSPREAEDLVLYQIAAVAGVAHVEGVRLQHVKPHGALYNMASRDVALAGAIARAVAAFSHSLILLGPPDSELLKAGRALGLRVVGEAFADRAYEPDGSLVARKKLGAIIHDVDAVIERSVKMAKERTVVAIDGSTVRVEAETICIHGDTPGADDLAAKLRAALERAGVEIKPMAAA
jgi:5-oxoprolinase (ATP-hydrolysing) subunit A